MTSKLEVMRSILQSLDWHSQNKPDAIAIQGTHQSLTWDELSQAVDTFTAQLQQPQAIGLHLQNSPAWAIIDLAALRAGVCHVPLPTFFSDDQLRHAVTDAGIEIIITDDPSRFESLASVIQTDDVCIGGEHLTLLRLWPKKFMAYPAHIAKVTYTSGTSGSPRGVILPLQQIETVSAALCLASAASATDISLALLPLSTLLENIGTIYVPILAGAQITIPDPAETGLAGSSKISVEKFALTLNQYLPTTLIVPPQLLKLLVSMADKQLLPNSFRFIAVGGAPCSSQILWRAKQLGLPVYQGYGLSEACSVVSVNTIDQQRSGSVGKPLPPCKLRITDEGEIMVQGNLFHGYINSDTENNNASEIDSNRELATGDLGYLDDEGYLFITGRVKDIIITGYGRNIAPEWVEAELQGHPAIAQAAVFGGADTQLTAVVTPSGIAFSKKPDKQLRQAIKEVNLRLPDYARVQHIIVTDSAFALEHGELTANGRPKRDAISRHYLQNDQNSTRESYGNIL